MLKGGLAWDSGNGTLCACWAQAEGQAVCGGVSPEPARHWPAERRQASSITRSLSLLIHQMGAGLAILASWASMQIQGGGTYPQSTTSRRLKQGSAGGQRTGTHLWIAPPECSVIVYYYYLLLSGPIRAPQPISHQRGWVSTPFFGLSPTQHRLCWEQFYRMYCWTHKMFYLVIQLFNLGDFIYNTKTSGLWSLPKDSHLSQLKQRGSGPSGQDFRSLVCRRLHCSLSPPIQEAPPTYCISLPL